MEEKERLAPAISGIEAPPLRNVPLELITHLSGPISASLITTPSRMFFILGDKHMSRQGICEEPSGSATPEEFIFSLCRYFPRGCTSVFLETTPRSTVSLLETIEDEIDVLPFSGEERKLVYEAQKNTPLLLTIRRLNPYMLGFYAEGMYTNLRVHGIDMRDEIKGPVKEMTERRFAFQQHYLDAITSGNWYGLEALLKEMRRKKAVRSLDRNFVNTVFNYVESDLDLRQKYAQVGWIDPFYKNVYNVVLSDFQQETSHNKETNSCFHS